MYQIFSRKTFFFMILWLGVCFSWLQTQAFACCWPWCCCYHQPEPPRTVTHREPLINHDRQSDQPSGYGTTGSQTASLSQKPQQDPPPVLDSRLPTITEHHEDTVSSTPLPSSKQVRQEEERPLIVASASSLGSSERVEPEWYDESFCFPSTPSQKVWEILKTTFGDERYPVTRGKAVTAAFGKIKPQMCESFTAQNEQLLTKLLYKKVTHYALDDVQSHVRMFVTHTKALWEQNPESFVFVYFPTPTSYYFFAIQPDARVLYIKMQLIQGQNDEKTLSSKPATRVPSRAVSRAPSRLPSPKREEEESKQSEKKEKKQDKKSSTGSDSDE